MLRVQWAVVENRRTSSRYRVAVAATVTIDPTPPSTEAGARPAGAKTFDSTPHSRESAARPGVAGAFEGASRTYTMTNLSVGGALLEAGDTTEPKLAMGTRIAIRFAVPTLDEPIEVGATVAWSDQAVAGIHFDGLRARDVWALHKFFEQLAEA